MQTIFFLIIAAVILWRLRSVLGTRTGHEPTREQQNQSRPDVKQNDNVIQIPKKREPEPENNYPDHPDLVDDEEAFKWAKFTEEGSALAKGFDAIHEKDGQFHPRDFLDGAKLAYEMIVLSFASGDRDTLKPLLAPVVYDGFSQAIETQKEEGRKTDMTFVGIQNARFVDAGLDSSGKNAEITLRFSSEIITATYDKDETLIDGDPNQVTIIVDIWTFARDLTKSDPNWMLIATKSE